MNNSKCRLSIIVPVYNVQDTLERCVESLYEQGLLESDYEVILVNDGSTDNSLSIAQDLASKHVNLKLFSQKNQGLGGARNTGIREAQGNYLTFVDSDDYLLPQKLTSLLKICDDNKLDVLRFKKVFKTFSGREGHNRFPGMVFNRIYSGKEAFYYLVGSACASLFRRSIFIDYDLFFELGITQEDVEFTTRYFTKVKRAMIVDEDAYVCVFNEQSLSRDDRFEKRNKYICDGALVASLGLKYLEKDVNDKDFKKLIKRRINSGVVGTMIGFIRQDKISKQIVTNYVDYAKQLRVLPLRGRCISFSSTLFIPIINSKSLYFFVYNIYKRLKN